MAAATPSGQKFAVGVTGDKGKPIQGERFHCAFCGLRFQETEEWKLVVHVFDKHCPKEELEKRCHFCNLSPNNGVKPLILGQCSQCPLYYCSLPECRSKLDFFCAATTFENYQNWKRFLDDGYIRFMCNHCKDPLECPGNHMVPPPTAQKPPPAASSSAFGHGRGTPVRHMPSSSSQASSGRAPPSRMPPHRQNPAVGAPSSAHLRHTANANAPRVGVGVGAAPQSVAAHAQQPHAQNTPVHSLVAAHVPPSQAQQHHAHGHPSRPQVATPQSHAARHPAPQQVSQPAPMATPQMGHPASHPTPVATPQMGHPTSQPAPMATPQMGHAASQPAPMATPQMADPVSQGKSHQAMPQTPTPVPMASQQAPTPTPQAAPTPALQPGASQTPAPAVPGEPSPAPVPSVEQHDVAKSATAAVPQTSDQKDAAAASGDVVPMDTSEDSSQQNA